MYIDSTLKRYLDDMSARLPAPGGGSAAALTAALGASLVSMVLNFTIGKEEFRVFEIELRENLEKIKRLKDKLASLVDEDVEVYKKVSATFSSKDGTVIEKSLKDAVAVPIETCNCCYQGMVVCKAVMDKTNKNLISDIGVAAELLLSAYNSAIFNIDINLKGIIDREFSSNIKKVIKPQTKEIQKLKKEITGFVNKEL